MKSSFINRPSSQIRRIVRNGMPVYEKQYVTNDWDEDVGVVRYRASQEVALIRQLVESNFFGGRLGVVQIANANPEEAIIATHEIPGASLGEFILQKRISVNLLPWLLAGRWLRKMQMLPVTIEQNEVVSKRDPEGIVDYCNLRLRSLADYGYRWPNNDVLQAILKTIEGLRDYRESRDLRPVWVHADYSPGNLMWDGRTFTPIDFAMARAGGRLEDATYLIHRLEMAKIYRPWIKLPVVDCRRAILRGLGQSDAANSPQYKALMIKHLICRLHTYVRRPAKNYKQAIHDYWVRGVIRRKLLKAVDSA